MVVARNVCMYGCLCMHVCLDACVRVCARALCDKGHREEHLISDLSVISFSVSNLPHWHMVVTWSIWTVTVIAVCALRLTLGARGSVARWFGGCCVGGWVAPLPLLPRVRVLCPSPAAERAVPEPPPTPPSPPSSPPRPSAPPPIPPPPAQHYHTEAESLRITAAAGGIWIIPATGADPQLLRQQRALRWGPQLQRVTGQRPTPPQSALGSQERGCWTSHLLLLH